MKKIFLLPVMAAAFAAICFSSCTGKGGVETEQSTKTLVAYFSASGITRGVAENLAAAVDADLFEIVPAQLYTDADLDWRDSTSRSTIEMKDPASRVAIATTVDNMAQYDTIFVGFPIWWHTAPHIIPSFLESYDLSGKVIIPFATSGSSRMENTVNDLKPSAPQAQWHEGDNVLAASITVEELKEWAKAL